MIMYQASSRSRSVSLRLYVDGWLSNRGLPGSYDHMVIVVIAWNMTTINVYPLVETFIPPQLLRKRLPGERDLRWQQDRSLPRVQVQLAPTGKCFEIKSQECKIKVYLSNSVELSV